VLRSVLSDAIEAFLTVLDTYTLADLIKPQKAMLSLSGNNKDRLFDHRASITMSDVGAKTAVR
jgi:hypothetical protein